MYTQNEFKVVVVDRNKENKACKICKSCLSRLSHKNLSRHRKICLKLATGD